MVELLSALESVCLACSIAGEKRDFEFAMTQFVPTSAQKSRARAMVSEGQLIVTGVPNDMNRVWVKQVSRASAEANEVLGSLGPIQIEQPAGNLEDDTGMDTSTLIKEDEESFLLNLIRRRENGQSEVSNIIGGH